MRFMLQKKEDRSTTARVEAPCSLCGRLCPRSSFSPTQWSKKEAERQCNSCSQEKIQTSQVAHQTKQECSVCKKNKGRTAFRRTEWAKDEDAKACIACSRSIEHKAHIDDAKRRCDVCGADKPKAEYSAAAWTAKDHTKNKCIECERRAPKRVSGLLTCKTCTKKMKFPILQISNDL